MGTLMDQNKAAASAEVKALEKGLNVKIGKLRARNARNSAQMASDLKSATKKLYGKMAAMQKFNAKTAKSLNAATSAAATASRNALKRAQKSFGTKMAMLTSVIAANAARAQRVTQKLTGVANNINKANKKDRANIRAQTSAMQADMNKRIVTAVTTGEALGKAVQQRLTSNLKSSVRSMRVELAEGLDRAADRVLRTVSGKRHKMADNYLSLKAYSVAAIAKGKGRNLSSIGDLVQTIGALGAAHAVKAQGLGMGGSKIRSVFSGKTVKVGNSLAAVNGLVNEYAGSCKLVRARWPMGLGKYLMDKLEVSMLSKGVLQVDKIGGKKGNFVYINGRSDDLRSPCSPRVCSRSTRSEARRVTSCTSTVAPSVCPTSSTTSRPSPLRCPCMRPCSLSSLPSFPPPPSTRRPSRSSPLSGKETKQPSLSQLRLR